MLNDLLTARQRSPSNAKGPAAYLEKAALPPNRSKLKRLRRQVANAGYWIEALAISQRITEFYAP